MITIVLMKPENEQNLGFIARAMKNFELSALVLINPKCDHTSGNALMTATHAKTIIQQAKVVGPEYLDEFDHVVRTTAMLGTTANILRSPLTPEQFAQKVKGKRSTVCLLLGRESSGLLSSMRFHLYGHT